MRRERRDTRAAPIALTWESSPSESVSPSCRPLALLKPAGKGRVPWQKKGRLVMDGAQVDMMISVRHGTMVTVPAGKFRQAQQQRPALHSRLCFLPPSECRPSACVRCDRDGRALKPEKGLSWTARASVSRRASSLCLLRRSSPALRVVDLPFWALPARLRAEPECRACRSIRAACSLHVLELQGIGYIARHYSILHSRGAPTRALSCTHGNISKSCCG